MKAALLEAIRRELRARVERLSQAAREAHAAATDPGSKAESKYDTRSLEASYLASGQARQVAALEEALRDFESFTPPDLAPDEAARLGALVEIEQDGESSWFLLAPAGGGMDIEHEGIPVTLLAPESPLYNRLLGMATGDSDGSLTVLEVT